MTSSSHDPIPPNTVIVLPKPLPMNRSALWTLFTALGLLAGLFLRDLLDTTTSRPTTPATSIPGDDPSSSSNAAATSDPSLALIATTAAQISAVLYPSPTPTRTPSPATTPTRVPLPPLCADPVPGLVCTVPFAPPPTPTPFPLCPAILATPAHAGDLCRWPAVITGGFTE